MGEMMGYEAHCRTCGEKFTDLYELMSHVQTNHSGGLVEMTEEQILSEPHFPAESILPPKIRTFDTGATRDSDEGKLKYEGFFSPEVLRRRAEYMHEHRKQADGTLRDPDNWMKGLSRSVYMDSLLRHVVELWLMHRSPNVPQDKNIEDVLCAIMFNTEGYLYEQLKHRRDHVAARNPNPSGDTR